MTRYFDWYCAYGSRRIACNFSCCQHYSLILIFVFFLSLQPDEFTMKGIGRVALLASILGTFLGMNIILFLQLTLIHLGVFPEKMLGDWPEEVLQMAMQWTVYVIILCTFHLGEFFSTALFNPSVVSSNSFMVNHSKAYTTAALVSFLGLKTCHLGSWCSLYYFAKLLTLVRKFPNTNPLQ